MRSANRKRHRENKLKFLRSCEAAKPHYHAVRVDRSSDRKMKTPLIS